MPKQFYTEKDIEDLFQNGVRSLQVTQDIVLTELAYEKARRLGVQLISDQAENPPAAPVRPYLSETTRQPASASVSQNAKQTAVSPALSAGQGARTTPIEQRIRSAVIAKLGNQVDANLLDNIIHRVVKGMGLK